MPIPKTVEQHYGVQPESFWSKDYFAIDPNYLKPQVKRFESLYGRSVRGANLTALDVGAGIGKAMIALSSAGFDTFGVEPSEQFYKRAIDTMGVSERRLKLTTVEEASFEKASFDFIIMEAVLEHLYDPSSVIQKALGWLKPGGFIYIEVPSADYLMSRLARLFYKMTGSDYVINTCPMHAPFHLYEFTIRSFMLHSNNYHYRIARYEYYVCESYMPRVAKPLFNATMKASNTGMEFVIWLAK
jgi:2-polyprenyl-3-methyl-5-hydroxy-6-metoxy-1,4-benzoquinol methylase